MSAEGLCAREKLFVPIVDIAGPMRLERRAPEPYAALVAAIAGQQLHAKAAEAILRRLAALAPGQTVPPPATLLAADEAVLRGCGFSGAKITALKGLAVGALSGLVPTRRQASRLTDEALIARLTSLRGVGRWTVEMLLIFTLGRPDVLPVDDFAIREGFKLLTGASTQPAPRALAAIGAAWAPHRTTAAWYLWRAADLAKRSPGHDRAG